MYVKNMVKPAKILKDNNKRELISRCIYYYYMDGLTQEQVAENLDISRAKVVRYLDEGRNEGLVQIHVRPNIIFSAMDLEKKLSKKFNLVFCKIIPKSPRPLDMEEAATRVAKAVSIELLQYFKNNSTIAIGWGQSIMALLQEISPLLTMVDSRLNFVTLSGGVGSYVKALGSQYIAQSHTNIHIVPAPLAASNDKAAKFFKEEPAVKNIFSVASEAQYALVGVGSFTETATLKRSTLLTKDDYQWLENAGATGDILGYAFDEKGQKLSAPHHNRLVSQDVNDFMNIGIRIGIAASIHKCGAIQSALHGGWINGLILDEDTAEKLCT